MDKLGWSQNLRLEFDLAHVKTGLIPNGQMSSSLVVWQNFLAALIPNGCCKTKGIGGNPRLAGMQLQEARGGRGGIFSLMLANSTPAWKGQPKPSWHCTRDSSFEIRAQVMICWQKIWHHEVNKVSNRLTRVFFRFPCEDWKHAFFPFRQGQRDTGFEKWHPMSRDRCGHGFRSWQWLARIWLTSCSGGDACAELCSRRKTDGSPGTQRLCRVSEQRRVSSEQICTHTKNGKFSEKSAQGSEEWPCAAHLDDTDIYAAVPHGACFHVQRTTNLWVQVRVPFFLSLFSVFPIVPFSLHLKPIAKVLRCSDFRYKNLSCAPLPGSDRNGFGFSFSVEILLELAECSAGHFLEDSFVVLARIQLKFLKY